jgi:hypothetical protein
MGPPKKAAKAATPTLTPEWKEAMAQGRRVSAAIQAYLEALQAAQRPRRPRRTPAQLQAALKATEAALRSAPRLRQVELEQRRLNIAKELAEQEGTGDAAKRREAFIANVKAYSQKRKISAEAWRSVGVPVEDLKDAGMM